MVKKHKKSRPLKNLPPFIQIQLPKKEKKRVNNPKSNKGIQTKERGYHAVCYDKSTRKKSILHFTRKSFVPASLKNANEAKRECGGISKAEFQNLNTVKT